MIAVDTSALMAVVLDEAAAQACRERLEAETRVLMSAGTLVDALIVSSRRNVREEVERLVDGLVIEIMPVTASSARRAASIHRRWGKGIHPAGLNFGDCFAYEVAESNDCPLLFGKTDLRRAI